MLICEEKRRNGRIRNYINDYIKFLNGKEDIDKILKNMSFANQLTQEFKFRRQEKLNVKEKVLLKKYKFLSDTNVIPVTFANDQYYRYARWFFKYLAVEQFECDKKRINIKLGEVKTKYTFIKPLKDKIIQCPNCGNSIKHAENDSTQLITKCPYCKTIINTDDLKIKLTNFNIWLRNKETRRGEKIILAGLAVNLFSFFLLLPIGIGLILYGITSATITERNREQKEKNIVNDLLTNVKISIENIKDNIINKIYQIHYCEKTDQISYFLNTNIEDNIKKYEQVISVNIINIYIARYYIENDIIYIDFNIILDVFFKNEDNIEEKFEEININVSRKNDNIEKYCDSEIFSCKNCGSKDIDIFNTGKCNYCGTQLNKNDTIKYDWILNQYNAKFIEYKN